MIIHHLGFFPLVFISDPCHQLLASSLLPPLLHHAESEHIIIIYHHGYLWCGIAYFGHIAIANIFLIFLFCPVIGGNSIGNSIPNIFLFAQSDL